MNKVTKLNKELFNFFNEDKDKAIDIATETINTFEIKYEKK